MLNEYRSDNDMVATVDFKSTIRSLNLHQRKCQIHTLTIPAIYLCELYFAGSRIIQLTSFSIVMGGVNMHSMTQWYHINDHVDDPDDATTRSNNPNILTGSMLDIEVVLKSVPWLGETIQTFSLAPCLRQFCQVCQSKLTMCG